ncbi:24-dehydrocholesterol reductase-like protein precursor [Mytilinidion resinicola]|uniref:Delta(24)-sterol reductase n=1 Tax=Mytilinidion resinicola TaxID=574789 RepID=A0A6A6Z1L8_9PEZI|nr:24-dehydrocholesterol reductase-like protein precursor [Mytilinidion resinicola]KAF2815062.1 24-dehydrocholesterol reductase-like protein precursor [Mytilinidion resinicola]
MEAHNTAVAGVAERIRYFYQKRQPFRIYHGSTLSTRHIARQRDSVIDTSMLSSVLTVDKVTRTAMVEPNVPMDQLLQATTAYGLLPPVVMEFPNITVGGGFAGSSGESSSFKYGMFDCTINSIEIVLANGDIVTASASDPETRDLFYGAAQTCGTLGVVTLLEVQLMESRPLVELTYLPLRSMPDLLVKLEEAAADSSVDYIDGIVYAPDSIVIMIGRLVSSQPSGTHPQRFQGARDPWFYLHARDKLAEATLDSGKSVSDYIPIADYLFRYDRGAFWGGAHAFKYFLTPFTHITRYLLDHFMRTRVMIHALHRSGLARQTIIQDLAVPYSSAEAFVDYLNQTLGFYPLWLCPVRDAAGARNSPGVRTFAGGKGPHLDGMVLNVGVWGMGPSEVHSFIKLNREIEQKVRELNGLKCLYAHAYYTESEFWDIYDEKSYTALREKYHATSLPSIFDKVKVDSAPPDPKAESWSAWANRKVWDVWPLGGVYGVLSSIKGGEFLLGK